MGVLSMSAWLIGGVVVSWFISPDVADEPMLDEDEWDGYEYYGT